MDHVAWWPIAKWGFNLVHPPIYILISRPLLITPTTAYISVLEGRPLNSERRTVMGLKPGPKPIAQSTGKPDQRRRDNKDTPGNTPSLKPSKSTKK